MKRKVIRAITGFLCAAMVFSNVITVGTNSGRRTLKSYRDILLAEGAQRVALLALGKTTV